MTTATRSNFFDMTSDAGFRTIGSNMNAMLAATGLVQTSDTGQINWTTVTKPGAANTSAGYEIWQFTDSVGSIYCKLEYGTGTNATQPGWWVTFGTGSNGSGTLTGYTTTRQETQPGFAASSTTTNFPSYACATTGAFWALIGVGASGAKAFMVFGCARTCDSTGAVTGDGFEAFQSTAANNSQHAVINLSNGNTYSQNGINPAICMIPMAISSSNYGTGGNNIYQVVRHELPMPQIFTSAFIGTALQAEAGAATTTTMAIVGSTNHTFLFAGQLSGSQAWNASTALGQLVLIYE